ncbi:MAG: SdpI family protein [Gemmatimonadaceae bacterium]|nr:SdpI family protein [Gemmatimonadaceae bacterium]
MRKWLPGVLILAGYLFSAAVYSHLPPRVPTHWGLHGPDAWGSRAFGALFTPTFALALWALLRWLPTIDPRRASYAKFGSTYELFVIATVAMMIVVHVLALGAALGWPIRIESAAPALVGALFIVIGNALPRARPNWFFGVRTPWTLSSDAVWERTNRVAGYVMTAIGVAVVVSAFVSTLSMLVVLLGGGAVLVVTALAYSYVLWRREQRPGRG